MEKSKFQILPILPNKSQFQNPKFWIWDFGFILGLVVFGFCSITSSVSAHAVEVEPQRLEIAVPGGEASSTMIKVTNWQDYAVEVKVKPDYYRQILTANSIPPPEGSGKLPNCQDWMTFEPSEFELSPMSSVFVKCAIDAPSGFTGEHVGSIMFDEKNMVTTYEKDPEEPGNITLDVIPRFTMPVYITPTEGEIISGKIIDMKVGEGPTIGTIKTEVTVLNNGTMHIRPSGNLVFMDRKSEIIKTIRIGECLPVFPEYQEKIPVYCTEMFKPGVYSAICTINIGEGKLLQRRVRFRVTKSHDIE